MTGAELATVYASYIRTEPACLDLGCQGCVIWRLLDHYMNRLVWNTTTGPNCHAVPRVLEVRCEGTAWTAILPEPLGALDGLRDFQAWYYRQHGHECAGAIGRVYRFGAPTARVLQQKELDKSKK